MKFQELANLFYNLESTSKRLEMKDLLASFFEDIKKSKYYDDLDKIVYLLQGHLVSNIKQFPKLGIAEKMIIEALSIHSGINGTKIKEILIKKGDVGGAAEEILSKKKKQKSLFDYNTNNEKEQISLEITELYSELEKIATSEGTGSHDIKLGILRGLMRKCSPLEAKYLLRIITSTLRVGVSTQTIIDGISLGFTGSKENRDIVERAYNLHPDLGDITKSLAEKGIKEVSRVEMTYGIPTRMMLASRIPYLEIPEKLGTPFIVEYKLDGERLQVHKKGNEVFLFSRILNDISNQYPDVCQVIRDNVKVTNAIIEGEVVAMDAVYEKMQPFQVLSKRRRKYDVSDIVKEVPVSLFVFDLLQLEEESFIDYPFPKRRLQLKEIIEEKDEIRLVESLKIKSTEELLEFFNKARDQGAEGIMAKSIQDDSYYQAGNRGFQWIKMKGIEGSKLKDTIDVVLIGANYGRGRRKGVYGTYIGAVIDKSRDEFVSFTKIASGLTDDIMDELMDRVKSLERQSKPKGVSSDESPDTWLDPEIVIEIMGDEITIREGIFSLRFPVFKRFRLDKSPKDVTILEEIKNLYQMQFEIQ